MNNFRKLALKRVAFKNDILTNFISKVLNVKPEKTTTFKEKFLKLPHGPEREKLVFEEILGREDIVKSIKENLVPVTVSGPNNIKITYKVMPDYITVDGIRVPMAGKTAQKIADKLNMSLPTDKMADQTWEVADVKIRPQPLSAGGKIGDKYYSGKEVVDSKISDSDSALAYSQMIEEELSGKVKDKKTLVDGHMKNIVMPYNPNKLSLYGWRGKEGDALQKSPLTSHDTSVHTEYGAGARLVDNQVTVTLPDGREFETTLKKILNNSKMYSAISNFKGERKY